MHNVLNQSSWFIRISSAHVDLIRNLMIHFTSGQIVSDLVQSCHQITLSHFKTYRINCHFYESFHFMTIHSTCVVFLVVTAAHKNAFGEIHHNLIKSVLGYHHIPDHIQLIIKSLYTNFKTSVITSKFNTPFIQVGRGVLEGDCLSPLQLLFNLCFNTFIQHIKLEKYQQFGFSYKLLNPT